MGKISPITFKYPKFQSKRFGGRSPVSFDAIRDSPWISALFFLIVLVGYIS
jgi:hypothetical protein